MTDSPTDDAGSEQPGGGQPGSEQPEAEQPGGGQPEAEQPVQPPQDQLPPEDGTVVVGGEDLTKTEQGASPGLLTPTSKVIGQQAGINDWARVGLAAALIAILALLTLGTCWYVLRYPKREPAIEAFLKLTFTPIIGLVGSVVGFYFGSKATNGSG